MSSGASHTWDEIVPHLDRALELEGAERETYLCELAEREPRLADSVRGLLDERSALDERGFLAESLVAAPLPVSLAGTRVGAYTIERLIGRGGMGEVWLAARSDGRYEGHCALKFLDASITSPKLIERFHREGHLLARLTHPNIARLLDAGTTPEGRPYLAIEYVDGEPIDRYCESLSVEARVRLFVDVVGAVAHAHSQLIIHRDLKPSNVLVTREGQVKLLDFGIAKLMSDDARDGGPALTRLEDSALTPQYAAPEQLLGELPSTATDVYQLGMLLYVLLTGRHPLPETSTHSDRLRAVFEATVPRASERALAMPEHKLLRGDLDAILDVALRSDSGERYATAQALKDDLLRYLHHEPVAARRGASWYRAQKFIRRHRVGVASFALGTVFLCAALVFALLQAREAQAQRDAARRELTRATASNDFTTFLLSVAAPGNAKFSAAELLHESERLIEQQYPGDNPLKADLLAMVGVQYMQSERWIESRAALERAAKIAETSGDPVLVGRSHCPLAVLRLLSADGAGARSLMTSALAAIPDRPEYTQVRAECLSRLSDFGYFDGDAAAMIKHASEALRLLDSIPNVSVIRRIEAQASLAYGYYLARDPRAEAEYASVIEKLEAAGRGRTLLAADLHNNWALIYFRGDIRKAEPLMRRTIELRRAIEGSDGIAPTTLHNYAGLLLRIGRFDEARPVFEETIRTAKAREELRIMFDAMMELADLYTQTGELQRAEAQLAELAPYLDSPRFGDSRRAQLAYYRGHLAEKRGDIAEARASYSTARDLFNKAKEKITMNVHALTGLARIEIAAGNAHAGADIASQALALAQSFAEANAPSYLIAEALLASGDSERARGNLAAATDRYIEALRNFEQTLGPGHPLTEQARDRTRARSE